VVWEDGGSNPASYPIELGRKVKFVTVLPSEPYVFFTLNFA